VYRSGSIVADFDIIYDSSNDKIEENIVQASVVLSSGSNVIYDGASVTARLGMWVWQLKTRYIQLYENNDIDFVIYSLKTKPFYFNLLLNSRLDAYMQHTARLTYN